MTHAPPESPPAQAVILRRLDPENQLWECLQREIAVRRATAAFGTSNQEERDAELKEISDTFQRYGDSDFGRKLYLVQNSIFGVDIQPIGKCTAMAGVLCCLWDQESLGSSY